jgi:hypothetical protein
MADTSGQSTIRGINIQELAVGFANEANIFKQFLNQSTTSARTIRYWAKTSGFLTGTTTTGMTASPITNVPQGALPTVAEDSWTRYEVECQKYFVESPWLTMEDLRDSPLNVLGTNVKSLTRAVENQVDAAIYARLSGGLLLSGAVVAPWSTIATCNPVMDILSGSAAIRGQSYDISNLALLMHQNDYKNLMNYIITIKGSSIPAYSSNKVETGVLVNFMGVRIVVSNNCTQGIPVLLVPQTVGTWFSFMPLTAVNKEEELIGTKIRIAEEGLCVLQNPNAGFVMKGA